MAKTEYLGLNLTEDESTTFSDWRMSIDGKNPNGGKSNMQLIDEMFAVNGIKQGHISPEKTEYTEKVSLESIPRLDGMWLKNGSLYTANPKFRRTDYIKVIPNTEYTLCVYYKDASSSANVSNGKIFDAQKNIIADLGDGENHILNITMPENARYIQFSINEETTNTDLSQIGIAPSAMYYQYTATEKELDWLRVTADNLSEEAIKCVVGCVEEKEKSIVKYKYGDSLNKPFDFTGKKIVAFGDSITQGYTSPNLEVKSDASYIKLFADKFGMTLHNKGIGGTCITDSDDSAYTIYKEVIGYNSVTDVIVISGGTNDFNTGKPLGDFNSTDVKTFYGSLRGMCEYLKTHYANATVIFITPIPVTKEFPNSILPLNAYRNAIYEIATLYGFNVVNGDDLGLPKSAGGWANEMIADSDGCHPTEAGHALYFRNLCGKLC